MFCNVFKSDDQLPSFIESEEESNSYANISPLNLNTEAESNPSIEPNDEDELSKDF